MESNRPANQINWKLWAGLILSALFLYLAFRDVDFRQTGKNILSSNILYLALAVLLCILQFFIRAWRWRILLNPVKETGFINRLLSVFVGFAANCLFPARLGEIVRANSLGQVEKISKSSVFGTIVIERIFDGFALLFIFVIGLMFTAFPDELSHASHTRRETALLLFISSLLLIVFIKLLRSHTRFFIHAVNRILFMFSDKLRKKISDIIENFVKGLSPLRSMTDWTKAILWSLLLWYISLWQIYFVEMAIGIKLPFIATFIVQSMAALGVMVPFAPGYIGVFHQLVKKGFIFYGISTEKALSAAILLHSSFYFPTIILGYIAFIILQKMHGNIDIGKEVKEQPKIGK